MLKYIPAVCIFQDALLFRFADRRAQSSTLILQAPHYIHIKSMQRHKWEREDRTLLVCMKFGEAAVESVANGANVKLRNTDRRQRRKKWVKITTKAGVFLNVGVCSA